MWYISWKYFSPFCRLCFHSADDVLQSTVHLFFPFVDCACSVISKNPLPIPRSWIFTSLFSSKSFMVLVLKFRLCIHLLIFVYVVKYGSNFIIFACGYLSQPYLWKRLFFPHWMVLAPLKKNHLTLFSHRQEGNHTSEISQTKTNPLWSHLHVKSLKKWIHR